MSIIEEWIPKPLICSAKEWREQSGRYRLVGSKCLDCGEIYFPRRWSCEKCHSKKIEEFQLKPFGTVVEATIGYGIMLGWEGYYPTQGAIIKLEDGPRIAAEIIECDEPVKPGTKVRMVTRKIGRDTLGAYIYGYKFIPESARK